MVDTLDDGTIVADELAEIFQEMDFAVIRDIVENTNGDIKQCVRFCCDMNPEMNEFDVCAAIVAKRREDDEKKKEEEKRRKKEVEKQRQSPDAERLQDRQERERRMKEAAERAAAEEERERRMKLAMKEQERKRREEQRLQEKQREAKDPVHHPRLFQHQAAAQPRRQVPRQPVAPGNPGIPLHPHMASPQHRGGRYNSTPPQAAQIIRPPGGYGHGGRGNPHPVAVAASRVPVQSPAPRAPAQPKTRPADYPRPPLDRNDAEKVKKYLYDVHNDCYSQVEAMVIIDPKPFQEGTMRAAFHMTDLSHPEGEQHFVCKMSKDPKEDSTQYFVDVEMQALARVFAGEYNNRSPPKPIDFIEASLVKCLERRNQPILAVEPFIYGKYVKHSNNYGFVSEEDRNTPHTFSHFSYFFSKGDLLICDIQGVEDKYTDPQIHSRDGTGFGKGNMGQEGIQRFFQTHHCNSICRYLKLPLCQPKQIDRGTVVPNAKKFNAPAQLEPRVNSFGASTSGIPKVVVGDDMVKPVAHRLTADEDTNIRVLFRKCDTGKGLIDTNGLRYVLKNLGCEVSAKQAHDVLGQIGQAHRGEFCDLRSFVRWWTGNGVEAF